MRTIPFITFQSFKSIADIFHIHSMFIIAISIDTMFIVVISINSMALSCLYVPNRLLFYVLSSLIG